MDAAGIIDGSATMAMRAYLLASARRALGGQTPPSLREYSFACDEHAQRVVLRAEVDHALSPDELSDISTIEGEIHSDFDTGCCIETVIEIVPPGAALHPLTDGIAYIRPWAMPGLLTTAHLGRVPPRPVPDSRRRWPAATAARP